MSIRINHALLLGSTTFLSLNCITDVLAQVEIPPVVVQAPSPIRAYYRRLMKQLVYQAIVD